MGHYQQGEACIARPKQRRTVLPIIGEVDAYTAIRTKRDTRAYSSAPLPDDVRRRILQAGRMAGSSKNAQPCHFIVVDSADQRQALSACGDYMRHVPSAPWVVAIAMPEEHTLFDAGRAAQNMMVAAWAEGVASCPVTAHDTECAQLVLGLPAGMRAMYVVAFGYPPEGGRAGGGSKRKPLDSIVHHERW